MTTEKTTIIQSSDYHYTVEPLLVHEDIRFDVIEWHMPLGNKVKPEETYRKRVSDTQEATNWITKRKYNRRRLIELKEIYGGTVL